MDELRSPISDLRSPTLINSPIEPHNFPDFEAEEENQTQSDSSSDQDDRPHTSHSAHSSHRPTSSPRPESYTIGTDVIITPSTREKAKPGKKKAKPPNLRDEVPSPQLFDPTHLPIKERIKHFTWAWFTMTMAAGGLANCLGSIPLILDFPGLYAIGCTVFLINIFLFICCVVIICIRFAIHPYTFRASFLHPTESLFIAAPISASGIILINVTQFGLDATGIWLEKVLIISFWIYSVLAILSSATIYLVIWSTITHTVAQMTPIWIFPAYPLLLVGPLAGQLAKRLTDPNDGIQIIIGGFIIQGIGFLVSLMIYSAFLYRLMTHKLPRENIRPGMFVSVGPSGFTISALINMGQALPRVVDPNFMNDGELVGKVASITANFAGLWLWGLALWFFMISVGAHLSSARKGRIHFEMTWFSFVFPNTALATATFAVASALGTGDNTNNPNNSSSNNNTSIDANTPPPTPTPNRAIAILGAALTLGTILMYLFVFGMMLRAIVQRQILWPQRQEDRDEGGWVEEEMSRVRRRGGEAAVVVVVGGQGQGAGVGKGEKAAEGGSEWQWRTRVGGMRRRASALRERWGQGAEGVRRWGRSAAVVERSLSRDRADYMIKAELGDVNRGRGRWTR